VMLREKEKKILFALRKKPLTAKEISDITGIPLSTVYRLLKNISEFVQKERKFFSLTLKGRKTLEIFVNDNHSSKASKNSRGVP